MKIVAIIFNLAMFLFTCLVLATDGMPKQASYVVFSLWVQLTRIFSPVAISLVGPGAGWIGSMKAKDLLILGAIVLNVVSLGYVCWAFVDQYPHPDEEGFIEFAVMMVVTPILSLVVLLRGRPAGGWLGYYLKKKTV